MKRLGRRKKEMVLLFLVLFLLTGMSLGLPLTACGVGGIDQPSDGLNSTPPPGGGGISSTLESLVLNTALNLVI